MTAPKPKIELGPVLRKPQAMQYTGLGPTQFDELIFAGRLPQPIRISDGGRAVAWIKSELDEWLAERIAKRDSEVAKQEEVEAARRRKAR
jgi:prophage regulatory protein